MRVVGLLGQQHRPGDPPLVRAAEGGDYPLVPKRVHWVAHHRWDLARRSPAKFCADGSVASGGHLRLPNEEGGDSEREVHHRSGYRVSVWNRAVSGDIW